MGVSYFERVLAIILFSVWTVILWALAVGKIVQSGIGKYVIHLTNWGWALSAVFFLLDLISRFDRRKGFETSTIVLINAMFWLVNGLEWIIFWLFIIIVNNNPDILEDEFKKNGGQYSDGFVLAMNYVFHVFPALLLLIYTILRRDVIKRSMVIIMDPQYVDLFWRVIYALGEIIIFPGYIISLYFLTTDISFIYGITFSTVGLFFIGVGVLIFHNGFVFTIFYLHSRRYLNKKRVL